MAVIEEGKNRRKTSRRRFLTQTAALAGLATTGGATLARGGDLLNPWIGTPQYEKYIENEQRRARQETGSDPGNPDQLITGAYDVDRNWPKPMSTWPGHEGWTWGSTQALFVESPDRIFVCQRGELPELLPDQDQILVHMKGRFGPVAVEMRGRSRRPYTPDVASMSAESHAHENATYDSPGEAGPYYGRVEGKDYRWEHIIMVFDSQGNLKEETNSVWKKWDSLFKPRNIPVTARGRVHKILISPYDPDKRIWAIDDGNQVIRIFSNDGKELLQTIGTFDTTTPRNAKATGIDGLPSLTKKSGPADKTFGRQTDLSWLPEGSFFVTDGYEETRVVKFDNNGKFVKAWGERGKLGGEETRPGYFNVVHGIVIDKNRRIYVNDRSNHRIQIFDEDGKFLNQWYLGPYSLIYHLYIDSGNPQHIWMSDARGLMLKYDLDGNMVYSWGAWGFRPGEMYGVHQFGVDRNSNFYTAEVHSGRPQKFSPKPGADPVKLVGQPVHVAW
jgi:NHL repeat